MRRFSESALHARDEGPTFLSRLAITVVLLTTGIGIAVLVAAA